MPEPTSRGEMPFLDHLEELRWRILYSLLAVVICTLGGWWVVQHFDVIGLLKRPIAPLIPDGRLVFTSPTDPFFITLKLAFVFGLLFASPVVVYQTWAFLAPALYQRERRVIIPAFSVGIVLFLAGATAAYLWVLPRALAVLLSLQRQQLAPMITADAYFGIAAQLIIAFGLITELPLVVTVLAALGVVTPQFLAKNRRYAIVLSAVAAALLSPPDAVSMIVMLVPLLLLYEISILCAWVMTRRRKRREGESAAGRTAALLLLMMAIGGALAAQKPVARPPGARGDTTRRGVPGQPVQGQALDTGAARRRGLPTGPSRSFPAPDAVLDSLLKLSGYRITQYVADTLVVQGDSQTIYLRGDAFLDREGTKLEADSVRYREASCRLDAAGDPRLFDQNSAGQNTVLIGEGMVYDTCLKRGTVRQALTSFQQGGATWFMVGDMAVDSGSTRLYGAKSEITSSDRPVPEYHFAAGEVKWLNKNVMVARPAVLYIRDVPIMWMPFIFQDIRSGRRSGFLVPRFGLNDLVRPTRRYERHILNLGYYWVVNDYVDFRGSVDWFAGHNVSYNAASQYRWLDRFITGSLSYTRLEQTEGAKTTSSRIGWSHSQSFDSRTKFNASIDYFTSAQVVQRNTVDPYLATAQVTSSLNFDKRFSWGTFNLGGSRSQNLANSLVQQNFPRVTLTPAPINIGQAFTWSPAFSYNNSQTFHSPAAVLLVPGAGAPDTVKGFFDSRQSDLSFATPLRIGRWNWSNQLTMTDRASNQRSELILPDSTDPTGVRHVLYGRTFETRVDWSTSINLPQLFSGSWKLQPGVQILNQTGAGPFAIRNQFTGGEWVHQGKRLAFSAGVAPTFFGFLPGFGPVARVRHSMQWLLSYQFAPAARVNRAYANAIDPAGTNFTAHSDPQQTISLALSQNFEAKLKPPPGDTSGTPPRKLRLLSINTSGLSYNFEQAKRKGFNGWQTQSITNTFASELIPFSLTVTHDLWRGTAGSDSARFDPFLTSVSLSGFTITGGTLRAIGGLLGLAAGAGTPATPPAAPPGETPPLTPPPGQTPPGFPGGGPRGVSTLPTAGRGFTLQVATLTVSRSRGGGSRTEQVGLAMAFSPTPNWAVSWNTSYDFVTQQFAQHYVRLERDLHRWHASFSFVKSANGNFAFNFYVSLLDQPDIKFDYDQQTFRAP